MTQELKLADDLFPSLLAGSKTCTIRAGKRDYTAGPLVFSAVNSNQSTVVKVTAVVHKKLGELTDDEAQKDGAATAAEMAQALKRFYPDITAESDITIVTYDPPAQPQRKRAHQSRNKLKR